VKLITHLRIAPRLRMREALLALQHVFMAQCLFN